MHLLEQVAGLVLLAVFVGGLAWLLDDLLPAEMRDWKDEPLEDDEQTKGDAT